MIENLLDNLDKNITILQIDKTGKKTYHYKSPNFEKITGYSLDDFKNDPDLFTKIMHQESKFSTDLRP